VNPARIIFYLFVTRRYSPRLFLMAKIILWSMNPAEFFSLLEGMFSRTTVVANGFSSRNFEFLNYGTREGL